MSRDIAIGDTVHVKGVVTDVQMRWYVVQMNSQWGTNVIVSSENIAHHEPAPLSVGDIVLSKDGHQGVIRYIEDGCAFVVEAHTKRKSIRYLCDLQRVD